jgi:tetratricopeptide (TPR) repeat protein
MTSEAGGGTAARRLELVADQAVAAQAAADRVAELAAALAAGARALNTDGDLRASRQDFDRAYRLAEQAGDGPAMAVAALGLAGLWVGERRAVTGAAQLEARLQHVLALLDPHGSLALRLRVRLAGEGDYFRGEHAAILAVLDEARAAADPVLLAEALSIAHHCLLGPGHVTLRRELAAELTKASFATERRSDLLMGLLWQTVDSYSEGDPHAGRLLTELRDHLRERDHLAVAFVVSAIDVMLAIRAGRLTEAESLAAICASAGAAAGDVDHEWWSGAQLVTIRWYQGRLVELLPMLRDRANSPGLSAVDNSSAAALAVAAALDGDRHTAASTLAALSGADLAHLPRSSSWLVTMNGIVEAASLLQDAGLAQRAYELLRPYAGLPMVGGLGVTCFGSAHQALGVASLTLGQLDQAVDHLRAAVQHNLALAHWPAVLASRQRLARAYALRQHPGDADAGRRELELALSEAAPLGLKAPDAPGAGPPTAASPASPSGAFAQCRRVGRKWSVTWRQRSVLVEDSIGMVHLAVLIANPRQEIQAADLVAGLAALGGDGAAAHPVLDHEAIVEYRNRVQLLEAEIDQLDAGADSGRAADARAERDWLVAELTRAAGFGGRTRSFPDQGERARVAAGKAIRRALVRIAEADPVIGEHLRQTVHTGVRCSYWPA